MFLVLSGEVWIEQDVAGKVINFKKMEDVDSEEEELLSQSQGIVRGKTMRKILDKIKFRQRKSDELSKIV
jgi:hypothetical protein